MKNFQFSIYNLKSTHILVAFLIILATCYLLLATQVLADEVPQEESFVYLFHLYYDNGQLLADRDFEFKYDIIPDEYVPEIVATQFPYKGEIINFLNQVAATFEFDPRQGNVNFAKGKISVKAPYASDGQKVIFYDPQNRQLLTIFVSESSFCNDDGVCSFDKGEDQKTCPNDCKGGLPVQPTQTPPVSEEGESRFNQVILWLLIAGFASVGGWYGWRWWKKRKKEDIMANNQPPIINDQKQ